MRATTLALVCFSILLSQPLYAQEARLPLDLRNVVNGYIENNLELQAARYRIDRVKADQVAARLRPNPVLSVTAENLPIAGPTPFGRLYELGATYSETIERGGKRALRERAADATVSAAEVQLEDTMRRGVGEVKRIYFEALLARYNLDLANENRETFNQLVQFNQTRFDEGAIPELDLIKVRLERVKVATNVKQAELALRQTTIRLLEKLGRTGTVTQPVLGELTFSPLNLDLSTLRQFAIGERSDVRAAMADVTVATERLALERARGKADINPFAGYKRVGNDDTLLLGVTIPLKLRDQNQAEIARTEADMRAAQASLNLARNRAASDVEAAYAALQSSIELIETFQSELLQQADETRAITVAAYEEGGSDLLPVLEAQRTRSEVREQYFKTLFDYQASVVALELAVGREIRP